MSVQVRFAFDADAAGETNFFTLGDPVKGVLGSQLYTLGGDDALVDVTQYVRSVSVSRGRSRLIDQTQTGNASIVLDNRARLFDPLAGTAISPYSPSIKPRKNVQISVDGEPVFTGLVEDWDLDFSLDGDATTTAKCADGFVTLAQGLVTAGTATAQRTDQRINTVLTSIDWPTTKRDISEGVADLQADVVEPDTEVLGYLQKVNESELGALYMDRLGRVAFRNRVEQQTYSAAVEFGGTAIPYTAITIEYGTEQLYNSISLTRLNGGTAVAVGTASQTEYGIAELSKTGYLLDSDDDLDELAAYLLGLYEEPVYRINGLSLVMDGLSADQRRQVAALDVASQVQVTFSPPVGPDIVQFATVDRVSHSMSPAIHTVSLQLSQAQPAFILGSAEFGVLGVGRLGF